MKNDFSAVMVIYNKSVADSVTFACLKKSGVNLIVCDNSTSDFGNKACAGENTDYISMGGNVGLAKAYNKAVDALRGKNGYVCLFDDDTTVPDDYFEKLDAEIEKSHSDVYLPVVFDENGYMSPCIINGVLTKAVSSLDVITAENITGINSGMAINNSVFDAYRYDEGYFLDFIDHAFIRDMKKSGKEITVAREIEIKQSFSANDYKNIKGARKRFELFKKDYTKFCKESGNKGDMKNCYYCLIKRWVNINAIYRLRSIKG